MDNPTEGRPNRKLADAVQAVLAQRPGLARPELAALLLDCGVPLPVIARVLAADGARRAAASQP